jgi:hypothetical protein
MDGSVKSPRCLLCKELVEDNMHLLTCKHPRMQETQQKIVHHLEKSLHDHGNSELTNLIEIGLTSCVDHEWTANLADVSPEWEKAVRNQNEIGWIHIYRGRIARSMIEAMDDHYSSLGINNKSYTGERWAKRLIINLWKIVLELWTIRNELIHDKESTIKEANRRENTSTRIQRCYDFKDLLTAKERQQWFSASIEELMNQDCKFLTAWLTIVERLIRIVGRQQKARPPASRTMERFLNIHQGVRHQRRKPHKLRLRSSIHDMNPD